MQPSSYLAGTSVFEPARESRP